MQSISFAIEPESPTAMGESPTAVRRFNLDITVKLIAEDIISAASCAIISEIFKN
jgi:hypothetical protein